jgi:protein-S-isoprenylcysteine O-methyltransferase Ste14
MALSWAFSCGLSGALPFFYPVFFITMLAHRFQRDVERCQSKYGKDWDEYCAQVKYALIPFVL